MPGHDGLFLVIIFNLLFNYEQQTVGASLIAQLVKNPPAMQETLVQLLGQEDPLEKGQASHSIFSGFPGGPSGKESPCNVGDLASNPESGTFPGEGNGNPFQYSCLENPMDRGTWWAAVHGIEKSQA